MQQNLTSLCTCVCVCVCVVCNNCFTEAQRKKYFHARKHKEQTSQKLWKVVYKVSREVCKCIKSKSKLESSILKYIGAQ